MMDISLVPRLFSSFCARKKLFKGGIESKKYGNSFTGGGNKESKEREREKVRRRRGGGGKGKRGGGGVVHTYHEEVALYHYSKSPGSAEREGRSFATRHKRWYEC